MDAPDGSYEYWLGSTETKYSASGVERSVNPADTIRRAQAVLDIIGVTKVADVTDLDRVGIPNFMTVRPHEVGAGISYYNGKGTTRAAAHAGALMEAIERHAGERYDGQVIAASYHNLRDEYPCIDPLEIHVPMVRKYSEHLMLEWAVGYDLITRRPTLAPLNCVVSPYSPDGGVALFYSSTNGLASGNTRVDAVCHALCEIIERDATSLAMATSEVKPAVASLLADIGLSGSLPTEAEEAPLISFRGLPRTATALLRKLQGAGLEVELLDLTSPVGIATIACTITDPHGPPGGMNAFSGCGTHPDARIALTRALTEAAQSRLDLHPGRQRKSARIRARQGRASGEGAAAQPPHHQLWRDRFVSACLRQRRRRVHDRADAAIRLRAGRCRRHHVQGGRHPRRARDRAAIGNVDAFCGGGCPGQSRTPGVATGRVNAGGRLSSTTVARLCMKTIVYSGPSISEAEVRQL